VQDFQIARILQHPGRLPTAGILQWEYFARKFGFGWQEQRGDNEDNR
jgi:hypothetical protein